MKGDHREIKREGGGTDLLFKTGTRKPRKGSQELFSWKKREGAAKREPRNLKSGGGDSPSQK